MNYTKKCEKNDSKINIYYVRNTMFSTFTLHAYVYTNLEIFDFRKVFSEQNIKLNFQACYIMNENIQMINTLCTSKLYTYAWDIQRPFNNLGT